MADYPNSGVPSGRSTQNHIPGGGSFVPPSIRMMTGQSVMPGSDAPAMPDAPAVPLVPSPTQTPETASNPYYLAGYLKNYLGKDMTVQFLIGDSSLIDRTGRLMDVGASFIVLQPANTDEMLIGDLYAVKFVTIYR